MTRLRPPSEHRHAAKNSPRLRYISLDFIYFTQSCSRMLFCFDTALRGGPITC